MGKATATTWLAVTPSHNTTAHGVRDVSLHILTGYGPSFNAGNLAINLLKRNGLQSRTFYLTSTACVRFDATAALWNFVPSSVLFRSSMQRTRVFNFSYAQSVLVSLLRLRGSVMGCLERGDSESDVSISKLNRVSTSGGWENL